MHFLGLARSSNPCGLKCIWCPSLGHLIVWRGLFPHCLLVQCIVGVCSLNSRMYVCEIRCGIVLVLKHSFSNGVVFLDQSGVGFGLLKKF